MSFGTNQVHKNAILSDVSVKYQNGAMIAEMIFPSKTVNHKSDDYYVFTRRESYRVSNSEIGPNGQVNEVELTMGEDSYTCKGRALKTVVSQEEQNNADNPLDPKVDATQHVTENIMLGKEVRVAGVVFNLATYPAGNRTTLTTANQWDNYASADSTPLLDIEVAKAAMIVDPNVLVLGYEVFRQLRHHPTIYDRTKYTSAESITEEILAGLFDIEKVVVGRARYDSSNGGQTESLDRVWGKFASLHFVNPNQGMKQVTFGRTFAWGSKQTFDIRDDERGAMGANIIKVGEYCTEKIIASDAGYLIAEAVS